MGEIYKLIIRADGMVLGSPAYWFSVSGLMKNFLDRLTSLEQSELLEGKIAGAVAVAEETGGDEVVSYLIHTLNQMGFLIPPFGGAFFSSKRPLDGSWREKDLSNLGRNIVKLAKVLKKERLFLD
jgi:multimeric flavodoxin WrbA